MTLDPGRYECPEHHADLTGLVEEALEDQDTPFAYRRPLLDGRPGGPPVPGHRHLPRGRRRGTAPPDLHRDPDAMTAPVRPPSPADQAWADLAARLTPAASLDRIDTVTARAVTTITVIGVLLTGLGALSAGQFAPGSAARGLAVAAVITATLAVACALTAQVLTITRAAQPRQPGRSPGLVPAPVRHPRLRHPGRHPPAHPRRPPRRRHRHHHPAHHPRQQIRSHTPARRPQQPTPPPATPPPAAPHNHQQRHPEPPYQTCLLMAPIAETSPGLDQHAIVSCIGEKFTSQTHNRLGQSLHDSGLKTRRPHDGRALCLGARLTKFGGKASYHRT